MAHPIDILRLLVNLFPYFSYAPRSGSLLWQYASVYSALKPEFVQSKLEAYGWSCVVRGGFVVTWLRDGNQTKELYVDNAGVVRHDVSIALWERVASLQETLVMIALPLEWQAIVQPQTSKKPLIYNLLRELAGAMSGDPDTQCVRTRVAHTYEGIEFNVMGEWYSLNLRGVTFVGPRSKYHYAYNVLRRSLEAILD